MAEKVYVVPGLVESVLNGVSIIGPSIGILYYPNISSFLLGTFGALRLASNGVDPGPPDGQECVSFNCLGPYVEFPTELLRNQQAMQNFTPVTFAWDWRKSILIAGDALAARILSETAPNDQCSLVCHSAGGVVARRAWQTLKKAGNSHLVRRIITMGTPHWGSYFVPYAWSGGSSFLNIIWEWNNWAGQTILGIQLATGYVAWTQQQVVDLSLTWPSLYELLPVVGAPDSSSDPNRADLFDASKWIGPTLPSQVWLDHARTTYRDFALDPDSMPPQEVLIAVSGIEHATPSGLVDPSKLGTVAALGATSQGDSIVTKASAIPPTAYGWEVYSQHDSLYPDQVNNGNVAVWLALVVSPTPPPPPEQIDHTTATVGLTAPPGVPSFTSAPGTNVYSGLCVGMTP
jgi:hypothetical protein